MTKYEFLIIQAEAEGATVIELDFGTSKRFGQYIDGLIIINRDMLNREKFEILAEELGHHRKTYGIITDQSLIKNQKLELVARREGYEIILQPRDLIKAIKQGACNIYEFAEILDISEDVLRAIIQYWKNKYGIGITIDGFYINLSQI